MDVATFTVLAKYIISGEIFMQYVGNSVTEPQRYIYIHIYIRIYSRHMQNIEILARLRD